MKTTFPRSYLAAALHGAGDRDVRQYLNGVLVEVNEVETRLVGCNGHMASVLRVVQKGDAIFALIVPRATVELALKMKIETMALDCVDSVWSLCGLRFQPVDGRFPDYRRIIPGSATGEAAHYHPDLVGRLAKIGKELKTRSIPIIRHSGKQAALVHFYQRDEFVGVVMPFDIFTEKSPDIGFPTWGPTREADTDLV